VKPANNLLYKVFFENFGYKLVSFLAALALWGGFVGRGHFVLDLELDLNYLLPANFALQRPPEKTLHVRLKGPEALIKKYSQRTKAATIDLVGLSEGVNLYHISDSVLSLPPGIKVLSISPSSLAIHLVRIDGENSGR